MNHLDRLYRELAAEAREARPSAGLESRLLAEFDRRRGRRAIPWVVAGALAASLVLGFWLRPAPVASKPAPAPASQAVAQRLPVPVPEVQPRPAVAHRKPTAKAPEPEFFRIPYSEPLAPYERAEIVRMELPVSALRAAGIQVSVPDAGAKAEADVVIGQDGMARAVRLISFSSYEF